MSYLQLQKRTFLLVFFFSSALFAAAQTATISGTVKDVNGQSLEGASITIQGTSKGAVADKNGNYSISANPGKHTLIASFVGYATQRTEINLTDKGEVHDFVLTAGADLGAVDLGRPGRCH